MDPFRIALQLAEACGSVNRWYCSKCYGVKVDDQELLLIYFIKSGGAADFAKRYAEAMGEKNRWFCSEFYGRQISDPEILWDYFVSIAPTRAAGIDPRKQLQNTWATR